MSGDWIKLYRKLIDSLVFDNEKLLKVWIWALLKANHKPAVVMIGYQTVTLKPGEFIFGREKAAEQLKMNPSTVRNCIALLVKMGNLDIKTTNKFSIITIKGWNLYQGEGQQNANKMTTKCQQNDTNKNVKNEKKLNNSAARPNLQINRGIESIGDILNRNQPESISDNRIQAGWQVLALDILKAIPDAESKRASVFKACKENENKARMALVNCKELGKLYIKYFFKIYGLQYARNKI